MQIHNSVNEGGSTLRPAESRHYDPCSLWFFWLARKTPDVTKPSSKIHFSGHSREGRTNASAAEWALQGFPRVKGDVASYSGGIDSPGQQVIRHALQVLPLKQANSATNCPSPQRTGSELDPSKDRHSEPFLRRGVLR